MALKYPDRLESNNPGAYGIVKATEVAGHKTVANLTALYGLADCILSDSKANTGSDAVGQEWWVVDQNAHYRLTNWASRKSAEGWSKRSDYALPLAANGTRGGIQIGYTENGKNYAVKLDGEKAYVTVNWTDTKVTQAAAISTNGTYNLLIGNSANTNAETAGINKAGGLIYNPSTKTLTTTTFVGALNGNAATATKATQDASGNVITATYATKSELETSVDTLIARIAALEAALTIKNV